ncbi:DUF5683 domain-containing protein [Aureispira sp. CCB-E]|uniref:DUF5683 domain-containing protein n=1 Tax=Aureispira sp. CCB-E TaxID=3051121 RepID=UPI002869123B|nr:DUF5683 domain-containing protein [Aureispira sp. CCB-E]WMX12191.1 DUF5683 domain-containing protein [Aureispira sp. CCB-E]
MFGINFLQWVVCKKRNYWRHSLWVLLLFISQNNLTYAQQDSIVQEINTTDNSEFLRESRARQRQYKKEARRERFLSTLPKNHNPKTATLLALIPGAGQIYNRRYWKLPIVYGGLGALGYFTVANYSEYACFRKAYLHTVDQNDQTNDKCYRAPDADSLSLKIYRDNAQESAELFLIGLTLFYGLTIIDAFVDAHLMRFDISDDLSMRIEPRVEYNFVTQNYVPSVGLAVMPRVATKQAYPVHF